MGLLTPKNNKSGKKAANKLKAANSSSFLKSSAKPAGSPGKKILKTGGSRGS